MRLTKREEETLQKLVTESKLVVTKYARRLADLQASRDSAQTSLDWLAQGEQLTNFSQASDFPPVAGTLGGAGEKRQALRATIKMLDAKIIETQTALDEAVIEREKLEGLLRFKNNAALERKAG